MINHNDNSASSINVLAEGELDQVVGGCGRGHRRGGGYGGWGSRHGYDKGRHEGSYDKDNYDSDSYAYNAYYNLYYAQSYAVDAVQDLGAAYFDITQVGSDYDGRGSSGASNAYSTLYYAYYGYINAYNNYYCS